jgi:hypothetical protein
LPHAKKTRETVNGKHAYDLINGNAKNQRRQNKMGKIFYTNIHRGPRHAYQILNYNQQGYGIINPNELKEWLKTNE